MTLDLCLILGFLLLHPLVNASATSGTSSRKSRRDWTGYLNDRSKGPVTTAIPKPKKDIAPIEKVPETESRIWAEKAGNVHAWCLQEMVKGTDDLFWNYARLMKEWFPDSRLYVYHSPYKGSLQSFDIARFHPVRSFVNSSFPQVLP